MGNAVHLLCRALRRAPRRYEYIQLEAAKPLHNLAVYGGVLVAGREPGWDADSCVVTLYQSIAGLAAAMEQFSLAEGLAVHVSLDECRIIVRRSNSAFGN